jgi:multisubunit Na+/H+ antiporter MnhF subunit
VTDFIWIAAIALASALAAYISRVLGLACIALAILVAMPLWALAAGRPIVLAGIVVPAIVGFVGGRLVKKGRAVA